MKLQERLKWEESQKHMLGGHKPCIAAPLRGLAQDERLESFRRAYTL